MPENTAATDDADARKRRTRAKELAKNDYLLMSALVTIRKESGLSQAEVADRLGITQQAVSKIESYDADPRLSTVRRYAHAVEALVVHLVDLDRGQLSEADGFSATRFSSVRLVVDITRSTSPGGPLLLAAPTVSARSDFALSA
jgi:transcriptional regulator with XRE-family HTH domain